MKQTYRPAVFVVTYAREKDKIFYAILKRHKHWKGWEFPKGGVEKSENLLKAVKREVFEETGLKTKNIKKWNISGKYKYSKIFKDRPEYLGQTYKLFSAEVKKAKISVDKREHHFGEWMEFEKAIKKLKHQNQKKCLRVVDKFLKS
jgi:8-oxo-dGTP pyrophosphatase MutT (NUDIX family)